MRDIIKRPKVNLGHLMLINKTLKMRNTNIYCSDLSTPMTRSIYQGGKLLARFLTTRAERAPLTLISLLVFTVYLAVCSSRYACHFPFIIFCLSLYPAHIADFYETMQNFIGFFLLSFS